MPALALNTTSNTAVDALQVICAWPVSGQYGPGSRILYYVLVAACVFARKAEWLRNACLAAALLFPAVAAIHGIVLASLHENGQYSPLISWRGIPPRIRELYFFVFILYPPRADILCSCG